MVINMEISNVFKNSLSYPLSNYKNLLIFGVISILADISSVVYNFSPNLSQNAYISTILSIISIIFLIITFGYVLSNIKETINGSDIIPEFSWKSNFVMGIKYIILSFVYFIIPVIITLIVAWATGVFDSFSSILNQSNLTLTSTQFSESAFAAVPQSTWDSFITSSSITVIVGIILAIIFSFFTIIGACRLADSGSLVDGLKINDVWKDISQIGWGNFIIWFIILVIITIILFIIGGFISIIPYLGIIITTLIIVPFINLFLARAMGLAYSSK